MRKRFVLKLVFNCHDWQKVDFVKKPFLFSCHFLFEGHKKFGVFFQGEAITFALCHSKPTISNRPIAVFFLAEVESRGLGQCNTFAVFLANSQLHTA